MNTYLEAEDALIHISRMMRTILDAGVRTCYDALDNTETTTMKTYAILNRHGLYCVYTLEQMQRDNPTDVGVEDMDAAIEADGWCGTYIDVEPVVVIEGEDHQHGLPTEADAFLEQETRT